MFQYWNPYWNSSPCRGFISLEGKSYVLEPSPDHSDGTHWIYTAEHLNFAPGTCGHDFNMSYPSEYADSSPFRTFSSRVRIIKLSAFSLLLQVYGKCLYRWWYLRESNYLLSSIVRFPLKVESLQERKEVVEINKHPEARLELGKLRLMFSTWKAEWV